MFRAVARMRQLFAAPGSLMIYTMDTQVVAIQIWPLQIPLRKPFKHAAAQRSTADPIVVEVELADGTIGYGETLPRPYVTAETSATVKAAVGSTLLEALVDARPQSMPEALELAESLPWTDHDGQPCPAARAAVELALLDAYSRLFKRNLVDAAGWFGIPGYGSPGSLDKVRYSIVLGSATPAKLLGQIRLARLCGIRDFKLKLGDADLAKDHDRLDAVTKVLGRSLAAGKVTLRVDVNGAWKPEQAVEAMQWLKGKPVSAVEQPTPRGTEQCWPKLHDLSGLAIMADESLATLHDAEALVESGAVQALNVRISKNGGLTGAIRLAEFARNKDLSLLIGCMVGETAILSAAQVKLLSIISNATFVEGCFGWLLLRDDVGRRVQFGLAGRPPRVADHGLGMVVDRDRLSRLCLEGPKRLSP